jgi:hypothetical protein
MRGLQLAAPNPSATLEVETVTVKRRIAAKRDEEHGVSPLYREYQRNQPNLGLVAHRRHGDILNDSSTPHYIHRPYGGCVVLVATLDRPGN